MIENTADPNMTFLGKIASVKWNKYFKQKFCGSLYLFWTPPTLFH